MPPAPIADFIFADIDRLPATWLRRMSGPAKQLYVKVNGELLVCSDKECNKVEASI